MSKEATIDIAGLCRRLDWTQIELARFLGLSETTVSRWASNTHHATGSARELIQALDHATRDTESAERIKEAALQGATMRSLLRKALGGKTDG